MNQSRATFNKLVSKSNVFQTRAKITCNCTRRGLATTCFGDPLWELASGPEILISTPACDTFELNQFDEIIDKFAVSSVKGIRQGLGCTTGS